MFTVALFIIAKTWKQHRCSSVNERIRKLIYTKRERERERDSQVAQCKRIHLPMQETPSIPGSGRAPGEGNGNPRQYSCLGNPMDRGA